LLDKSIQNYGGLFVTVEIGLEDLTFSLGAYWLERNHVTLPFI